MPQTPKAPNGGRDSEASYKQGQRLLRYAFGGTMLLLAGTFAYAIATDDRTAEEKNMSWQERHAQEQKALIESIAPEFNLRRIDIPAQIYQLDRGSYEITLPGEGGPRRCIANVVATTHGAKNVVLNCN